MTVFSNPCSDTSRQDNTSAFPAMIEWATAMNKAIAPMEFPDALHYLMKDQKMTVEHLEEASLISTSTIIRLRACLKSFDKNGGVGDNRKKQAGAGENASIPK